MVAADRDAPHPFGWKRVVKPQFFALLVVWLGLALTSVADETFHELVIPLEEGRYYHRSDVERLIQARFGDTFAAPSAKEERLELGRAEKAALLVADLAGAMKVRFESDRLVLSVPAAQRRELERILQVGWGLETPRRFDPTQRSVVLIHGLEAAMADMKNLTRAFQNYGVQVLTFEYPNDGPLALSGARLSEDLKALAEENPRFQTVIVAHSMGGLVARFALETPERNPGCVTHLFTLGAPHHGSNLAVGQEWLEFVFSLAPHLPSRKWNLVNDGQGQAARDLTPGSAFLKTLNLRQKPQNVEYYAACGTRGFLTAAEQTTLVEEAESWFRRRGVTDAKRLAAIRFLQSPELCTGKGDGAVTLVSAVPPHAHHRQEFYLNHLELVRMADVEPADHPVFRWIIASLAWSKRP